MDRPRGRDVLVRQRGAAPPTLRRSLRACVTPRDEQRVSRVHRGGWLPPTGAVALRRLERRTGERLAGPTLLGARGGDLAYLHALGHSGRTPRRARMSRELLRGGCLCAVGRSAPADRGRV